MKRIFSLMLLCAAVVLAFGCKDDKNEPEITPVDKVTVSKVALALEVGGTETLTAVITPENAVSKAVTWSTSDAAIATVSDAGLVTAVKAGKVTITVASTVDKTKTATCEVTVSSKVVAVTGITLDATTANLLIGKTRTLVATVAPDGATDKTIAWSTSDETIATVDATGLVTAVKVGTATITATAGEKTATCEVEVYPVTVGNYFYNDGTQSAEKDAAKTAVGIVFWQDPEDPAKGSIVSLDQAENITWDDAMAWKSTHTLPAGMTWELPNTEALQYLCCAYNGAEPRTWGEYATPEAENAPVPNAEARAAFNAKLEIPFVTVGYPFYWSSSARETGSYVITFTNNQLGFLSKASPIYARSVAAF